MLAAAGDTPFSTGADKRRLRRRLRAWRRAIPMPQRAAAARSAARRALRLCGDRRFRHIALYLACGAELDTRPLLHALRRRGRTLYVPALVEGGTRMAFVCRASAGGFRRDRHGLQQPLCTRRQRAARRLDLVIVPLLGFDAAGTRLGQGGGYYDRAFARRSGHHPRLVGYAYAGQRCARLPRAPWDVRLDAVITERGLMRCRPPAASAAE